MKIEGGKRLRRQLKDLPDASRTHISDALSKSGDEGVRIARVLVPRQFGKLAASIHATMAADGMSVEIAATDNTKRGNIKAHTVEGGRDPASRGGAMAAQPFIGPTRSYLAKRWKGRVRRAVSKAAKEVAGRG